MGRKARRKPSRLAAVRKETAKARRKRNRLKSPVETVKRPTQKRRSRRAHRRSPTSRRRLWLFRVIAGVVIPVLAILGIELGLRLGGWGYPSAAVVGYEIDGRSYFCDNPKFTWRFFPPRIARVGEPFIFPVEKEDRTYRIFVLGASAALGTPDSAYSFARILEVMLAEAYPETNFQIANAAITAVNSHVAFEVARDCARFEPDLFLIYLGNNEVVGPYGPGTVFRPQAAALPLIRVSIRLKATRLGQLLTAAASKVADDEEQPVTWTGMAMFLENQVRATDPRMQTVYHHFRANLEAIRDTAVESGAAAMFCTVGSNLRDCPPFASLHHPDLTAEESKQWQYAYEQGIAIEQASRWDQAVASYLNAESIDDAFAELHFRLARCYWALGEFETARERYVRARELDTLRFRPDRRINEVIREVAGGGRRHVYLVDAARVFEANSPHSSPGRELFHEHVHLNFKGNHLLAQTVFEQLTNILPTRITDGNRRGQNPLNESACARRLAYTVWDRCNITQDVLNDYALQPPFTNQAYHADWVRALEQTLIEQRTNLTAEAFREVNVRYQEAIAQRPGDWQLHYKYATFLRDALDDVQGGVEHLRLALDCVPHHFKLHAALGLELAVLERYRESIEHSRRAIELMPTYAIAHNNLGAAYAKLNQLEEAKSHFAQAVRWSPRNLPAYNSLIDILVSQGKLQEAIIICRRAVRFAPDNALLHCKLGTVLGMQGKRTEALEEIQIAARLDPNAPEIRQVLQSVSP